MKKTKSFYEKILKTLTAINFKIANLTKKHTAPVEYYNIFSIIIFIHSSEARVPDMTRG